MEECELGPCSANVCDCCLIALDMDIRIVYSGCHRAGCLRTRAFFLRVLSAGETAEEMELYKSRLLRMENHALEEHDARTTTFVRAEANRVLFHQLVMVISRSSFLVKADAATSFEIISKFEPK